MKYYKIGGIWLQRLDLIGEEKSWEIGTLLIPLYIDIVLLQKPIYWEIIEGMTWIRVFHYNFSQYGQSVLLKLQNDILWLCDQWLIATVNVTLLRWIADQCCPWFFGWIDIDFILLAQSAHLTVCRRNNQINVC